MGGKSGSQTIGYRYYLGMHMALIHGPADKLIRIRVDKRNAWVGSIQHGQISVQAEDLFGGEQREGGVSGLIDFESGKPDQGQNNYLLTQLGSLVPAFRGVCAAVLRQCYVGMNPYLKNWDFRIQRIHTRQDGQTQWYDGTAAILLPENENISNWSTLEDFTSLANYTVESGNAGLFTIAYGSFGRSLNCDSQNAAYVSKISRTFDPVDLVGASIKFSVTSDAADDACHFVLYSATNAEIVHLLPRREAAYDALRRCKLGVNGTLYDLSPGPLDIGAWYEIDLEINAGAGTYTITLKRLSDGQQIGTVTFAYSNQLGTVAKASFYADQGGATCATRYSDLKIRQIISLGADMNPAHIVRECLTDPDWGMGYPESAIDDAAFTAAADALHAEGFGLSLLWDRQTAIEDFIKEVLRHIEAALYVDRSTGKFTLTLIRGDYDPASLPMLDESSIEKIENYKCPTLGELINSVTVTYAVSDGGQDATVNAQDIALAELQDGTIDTAVQYPGITHAVLAAKVAARDLKSLSTPLVSCSIYANRQAASLNVGRCFKLNWPDYGIANMVMRVTAMAYGDGRSNQVRITCTQDVFALPAALIAAPITGWVDPVSVAAPCPHQIVIEAPYYEIVQRVGQDQIDTELSGHPQTGYLIAVGDSPTGDALNARLMVNSGANYVYSGVLDFSPSAILATDIGPADTQLAWSGGIDLDRILIGSHAQIGDELIRIDAISDTAATVGRGCLDTVPASHGAGAALLAWDQYAASDNVAYVAGETVNVKILPVTGSGALSEYSATALPMTLAQRALRPYAPGQFKVNGNYWPLTVTGDLAVTWAHRDRRQQTAGVIIDTTAGNIGPEAGTTYTLRLYGELDNLLHTYSGLTGTAQTYDSATEYTDGGVAVLDPNWANVTLLLNCNGADASTTFTDLKGHTVTVGGNAQIDTAQFKFGGASALFDGAGDYLTVANSADWDFGGGDFTVELWFRLNSTGTLKALIHRGDWSSYTPWAITVSATNKLASVGSITGSSQAWNLAGTTTLTTGAWYHAALVRSGTNVYLFLNGALEASAASVSGSLMASTASLKIGINQDLVSYPYNGWFDDIRITKGVAVYTGAFTPPGAELGQYTYVSRLNGRLRVELESVRDGLASFQHHNHTVLRPGYGFNYGMFYGGQ